MCTGHQPRLPPLPFFTSGDLEAYGTVSGRTAELGLFQHCMVMVYRERFYFSLRLQITVLMGRQLIDINL